MRGPSITELRQRLQQAADDVDLAELQQGARQFVELVRRRREPVSSRTAVTVLKTLQRQRQVLLVQEVAEALLAHGVDDAAVRHRYALALLDADRIAVAEAVLAPLRGLARTDSELSGAIGRVHKQRYLTSGPAAGDRRGRDLSLAIAQYAATYRSDPRQHYYHGINAATLLVRAHRDRVAVRGHRRPLVEAREIATAILASLDPTTTVAWELATAAEACLVLEQHDAAVHWIAKYVGSEADAFQLASTLRQFQLAWRLRAEADPGLRLLPLLRNRLLQAEGGAITLAPNEFTPESLRRFDAVETSLTEYAGTTDYEAVYGWDQFQSIQWLRDALDICRAVARIETYGGDGVGTGFVLAGDRLRAGWPERVLVTNAHVVPDALPVESAYITFRGLAASGPGAQARVRAVGDKPVLLSPRNDYDVCVLELPKGLSDQVGALEPRKSFPVLGGEGTARAYVIGHPSGGEVLKVSLHDTKLLAAGERYAHYRSPTQRGSSGSPVFDDEWKVIALHHAAVDPYPGGTQPANEGIRFDKLMELFAS